MLNPKSVTGVLRLPDVLLNFYLTFGEDGKRKKTGKKDEGVELIGKILGQADKLAPEMQELLVKFAEFLEVDLKNNEAGPKV